jgi:hypothetical protein
LAASVKQTAVLQSFLALELSKTPVVRVLGELNVNVLGR